MSLAEKANDCPVDLIPTRSSLLGRLKDWEDEESWHFFFETYWRLIYKFALQRGLTHEESQEVVQETVVGVAKSITRFRYDRNKCSFKTWLLSVTRSKIADQFTKRARHPLAQPISPHETSSAGRPELMDEPHASPWDEMWDQEWRRNLLESAIRRVKSRVPIEQYQTFDLAVNKQMSPRDVASTLKVTVGHVYVAKHRIARLIRHEMEALEKMEL